MSRRPNRSRTRVPRVACTVLLAALVAAGCGSDDGDSSSSSSAAKDDGPVKVRSVTEPEPSEDLTEAVGEETATTLNDAGCTFGTFEVDEAKHIDEGDDLTAKEFPPTGGDHYENWAPFGLYDEPIQDGFTVHNLEHGGVAVWLGTEVDEATTDALAENLDDGEKWLVAPREDIEGLYSAAWGTALSCSPEALTKLGPKPTAVALEQWYQTVVATGSEAEKDVPAYAGAMKEPTPERDISEEAPF